MNTKLRPHRHPDTPTEPGEPLPTGERGLTPNELAKILRVSPDRVRAWIRSGQLGAINTAVTRCGKPRFVILPKHLEEFEQKQRVSPPPKPAKRPKRKPRNFVDYYPD
jgi:transposase